MKLHTILFQFLRLQSSTRFYFLILIISHSFLAEPVQRIIINAKNILNDTLAFFAHLFGSICEGMKLLLLDHAERQTRKRYYTALESDV